MNLKKITAIYIVATCVTIVALIAVSPVLNTIPADVAEKYSGPDLNGLATTARRLLDEHKNDSALMVYNVMTNYPEAEKRFPDDLCSAYNNLGYMYFYMYFNYEKAYQCFAKALDIAERYNLRNSQSVYLNMGNIYDFLENEDKALLYYEKGYEKAEEEKSFEEMLRIYCNMGKVALQGWPEKGLDYGFIAKDMSDVPGNVRMKAFSLDLQKALLLLRRERSEEAKRLLLSGIPKIDTPDNPEYYEMAALLGAGKIAVEQKELAEAIALHERADSLALAKGLTDYRPHINKTLARLYEASGRSDLARRRQATAYETADSVFNLSTFNRIHRLETLSEVEKINQILTRKNVEAEFQRKFLFILSGAMLVVAAFLVWIVLLYRREHRKNNALYQKNVELSALKDYARKTAPPPAKYRYSALSDEKRAMLIAKIEEILDSREVFSQGFTIETVAEACGSNKSYVSQVFNECYPMPFSQKVMQLRIEEASRIMRTTGSRYTVESIAESVGYKSRSSFSKAFVKITGLTPSDFISRSAKVL